MCNRTRRAILLLVVAAVAASANACAADDVEPTGPTAVATMPNAEPSMEDVDLREVLISAEDLPDGWSLLNVELGSGVSPAPTDEEPTNCFDRAAAELGMIPISPATQWAIAEFQFEGALPYLSVQVGGPYGREVLIDRFDSFPAALAACDGEQDADGTTYAVLPVAFPNVGADTYAALVGITGEVPVTLLMVVSRTDDMVMMVGYADVGRPADRDLAETILVAMHDRL